ncbi:MAG: flavodoxin [Sporomusa sp.]
MLGLTACGSLARNNNASNHSAERQEIENSTELKQKTNQQGRILIAYFTWADNTHVNNPAAVDVNAVTSASLLPPGNTAMLAGWIQEATGGDLFQIITVEPYSNDYDECLNRARKEHDSNARPALRNKVNNIGDYDVVFLGYPNWWYSCPMAILTFIEENDLSGKTIIPFCAHGTGGLAASVRDISKTLPNDVTVLKAFGIERPNVATAKSAISNWLAELNVGNVK